MEILLYIVVFVAGIVIGALVTRNNLEEVNKVVEEAKELAAKAENKNYVKLNEDNIAKWSKK